MAGSAGVFAFLFLDPVIYLFPENIYILRRVNSTNRKAMKEIS